MILPKVSCIILTIPERSHFLQKSIEYIKKQDYPQNLIEIIINDKPGTIGHKRNQACSQSHSNIIINWDDDDWQHPCRISKQVQFLNTAKLCGTTSCYSYDIRSGNAQKINSDIIIGPSLAYWKSLWKDYPFRSDLNILEDYHFIQDSIDEVKNMNDSSLLVYMIHDGNISNKIRYGPFHDKDTKIVRNMLGSDLTWYDQYKQ